MAKAVMNGNKTGKGFDKNPRNINRKGRPPRLLSHINIELLKEGYERVSPNQIQEAYELLFNLPLSKILIISGRKVILNADEVAADKKAPIQLSADEADYPMFVRIIARAMLSPKGKDVEMIEKMMDRAHGKALQTVESKGVTSIKIIRD